MAHAKAVITDYIGTLVNASYYNIDASRKTLHQALTNAGFKSDLPEFLEAYIQAHEKYRTVRYQQLREVTNAVWVCEALNSLGYTVNTADPRIKAALNVFFQKYLESLELRPYAKKLLKKIKECCRLGLISNFTYAPVIYSSLRKLGINHYFDTVLISHENGWRKPHTQIFQDALKTLQVNAEETVLQGAITAGIKTVFVPSQFYTLENLQESNQKPDYIATGLADIYRNLSKIINQ